MLGTVATSQETGSSMQVFDLNQHDSETFQRDVLSVNSEVQHT